jgi:hypothetical protein
MNAQLLGAEAVCSDERVSRIAGPRVEGMPGLGQFRLLALKAFGEM